MEQEPLEQGAQEVEALVELVQAVFQGQPIPVAAVVALDILVAVEAVALELLFYQCQRLCIQA
jgi:hypothetical protein